MAQIYGFLRDDKATHGERMVLTRLKENLPKEYYVYVECPLPDRRGHRYPDFIVVANYGVIVLEVKDWIYIQKADRYSAEIRMRGNEIRTVQNPVNQARDIAILLAEELKEIRKKFADREQHNIPWGYAVVLPNLGTATITQLRHAWGEEFVLHLDDLDPALIKSRLRVTLPEDKIRDLKKYELDFIRATINPTVLIEPENRLPVILDNEQELIISEPVKPEIKKLDPFEPVVQQADMFVEDQRDEIESDAEELPDFGVRLSSNKAIRLVRGIAGSGKTLVLAQRARYLAAHYPEWRICVLTYNKALQTHLETLLSGNKQIRVFTLHGLCMKYLADNGELNPENPNLWLETNKTNYSIIKEMGSRFLEDEICWMKDTGNMDRESYLRAQRKGRGSQIGQLKRTQILELFLDYQKYLESEEKLDWAELPHGMIKGIDSGKITPDQYDAVLIDEAQDFAPVWIKLVNRLLKPDSGILFLADDPAQSIYRFHSWREKGIEVVGRTRWLRIPYRNTYEIYQAAYQLIASDEKLLRSLREEGIMIEPDLSSGMMRHGPKPLIQRYASEADEMRITRERINQLIQDGINPGQIAVLHRHKKGIERFDESLRGTGVINGTFHKFKGLEFEAVVLCQLQNTYVRSNMEEQQSIEKRLVYMAMTRARTQLYMGYEGRLPQLYNGMMNYVDHII